MYENEKTTPLISVIIATYKREESLKSAIVSVLKQNYPCIEIIVVDDNADNTWSQKVQEIILECSQEKKITYVCNESNKGSAESRNIGIRISRGDYITFLDDDDLYMPDKVKNQVQAMVKEKADYSITDIKLYDENGNFIEERKRTYIKEQSFSTLLKYHFMYHMTGTDTFMFRKDYLMEIGGFPANDVGDEFYLMECAIRKGGKLCYLPRCDVKAIVHTVSDGLSSGESKIQGENRLYEYKCKTFSDFDKNTVRYIKMRHYAVLAYAELRRKRYCAFICDSFKAVFCSPVDAVKLLLHI